MSFLYAVVPITIGATIYGVRKLREYQWGWVRNRSSLKGKIFIVTGANTGLGYETTRALVKRQATVIMACRDLEKARAAAANIRAETGEGVMIPIELDLANFESIKKFATKIKTEYPNFDCLINNAGLAVNRYLTTRQGFELTYGTNHLGHFLLFNLLKETIDANEARIVVVSSKMHEKGEIDFETMGKVSDDINAKTFRRLYQDSKLANFYFARELFKRGYDAHVLCPGLCHTDFFRDYNPRWYHYVMFSPVVWLLLRSAEQGAQNIIHCATDNVNTEKTNPATGYFINSLKQVKSKVKFSDTISERLWTESEKMCELE